MDIERKDQATSPFRSPGLWLLAILLVGFLLALLRKHSGGQVGVGSTSSPVSIPEPAGDATGKIWRDATGRPVTSSSIPPQDSGTNGPIVVEQVKGPVGIWRDEVSGARIFCFSGLAGAACTILPEATKPQGR